VVEPIGSFNRGLPRSGSTEGSRLRPATNLAYGGNYLRGEEVLEGLASSPERATWFRALFGNERAFRAWYDDAVPRVYGYVYDRCGGVRAVAEELTQEAFVDAVRNRNRFDGRSEPLTWVIAIARHKVADHYRRLSREERRHLKLVNEPVSTTGEDPWSVAEDREDVLEALRSIPPMQRAVLVLHYLDVLPVSEIAAELERSESSIESLLSRGRESFRRALAAGDAEEARDA
jgi:RNA polymerase sigma-70 factor (ECF subfamily)